MRIVLFAALATSCAATKVPVSDAFDRELHITGTVQVGETVSASYAPPADVAWKLYGRAGDRIVLDVHSATGDAVAWLLDDGYHAIANNDDASDATRDAHIDAVLPANPHGTIDYYVVVRDYHHASATFQVAVQPLVKNLAMWRGRSIYFVVTDRFANGDRSNDDADGFASDLADRDAWHGGDFQGIIDHLDYIAGMGFDGLWITPVIRQHDAHAYHGYWGWDWSSIDPHLGDLAKLRELVAAAHARGIAVMIDTVANHTGRYRDPSPSFPDAAMYHHNGDITNWNDPNQLENFDVNGLADLAQENPIVRHALLDHVRWLVASTGLDGLRVDTAKHVPIAFWAEWSATAGVFTIGEALQSHVSIVARYSHALDAVLDYPLYYALQTAFARGGSARALARVFAEDGAYADPTLSGVFVDNHDQPRFLCAANGADPAAKQTQLELALGVALTARGLPIVYYGTEQGFGDCANNRQDMGAWDTTQPIYRYVAMLNQLRARTPALQIGVQQERWRDDTVYAFEREAGASAAFVGVNVGTTARTITVEHMHVAAGTALANAAGTIVVGADSSMTVTLPPRAVTIWTTSSAPPSRGR